jgi:hypothetical protein
VSFVLLCDSSATKGGGCVGSVRTLSAMGEEKARAASTATLVCPGTACAPQDFSEVVQQCFLGSPELSLKALVAHPAN